MNPIRKQPQTVGDRLAQALIRLAPYDHVTPFNVATGHAEGIALRGTRLVHGKLLRRRNGSIELRLRTDDDGFLVYQDCKERLQGRLHTDEAELRFGGVNVEASRVWLLKRGPFGEKKRALTLEGFAKMLKRGSCEFEIEQETYGGDVAVLRGFLWKGTKRAGAECWVELTRSEQNYHWNHAKLAHREF